jgi:NAD(P)-dependent dehydrogenase (short-subunit alcohol dehydrogenase family)
MVGCAYAATKAAALALRQTAIELAQYDIRINAIAPGPFATDIGGGRIHEQQVHDSFASRSTLKRIRQPKERNPRTGAAPRFAGLQFHQRRHLRHRWWRHLDPEKK